MKDVYDLEIERLQAIPDEEFNSEVYGVWLMGEGLFKFLDKYNQGGCLTMVKEGKYDAYLNGEVDDGLTLEIRQDERIPDSSDDITKQSLSVFAEWQRRVDKLQSV